MDRWITDTRPSPHYGIYSRANAGEVMPDPVSPFTADVLWLPAVLPGWSDAFTLYLLDPVELPPDDAPAGIFGGYLYISIELARVFGARVDGLSPESVDATFFGEMTDIAPYTPRTLDDDPDVLARVATWVGERLTLAELPDVEEQREEVDEIVDARGELTQRSNQELIDRIHSLRWPLRRTFATHILVTGAAGIGMGVLGSIAAAVGDPTLTLRLVAAIGHVDSAAPSAALWDLSRLVRSSPELTAAFDAGVDGLLDRVEGSDEAAREFLDELETFKIEFGSRGPNEWEVRSPTWGTHPEIALAAVDRMRGVDDDGSPRHTHEQLAELAAADEATVRGQLADDPAALGRFELALRSARLHLAGRERTKTTCIMLVHEARLAARELGRRAVELGGIEQVEDVFMLLDDELEAFAAEPGSFTQVIAERNQQYQMLFTLEPPFVFAGQPPPVDRWPQRGAGGALWLGPGEAITGIPGCTGKVTARARVLTDPTDPGALEPGEILVAPITDPSWTPLFVPAAGVVVDTGAPVSHAVIVSRELGIPCVVSAADATRRIPDGALVAIDGDLGTVTLLEGPA